MKNAIIFHGGGNNSKGNWFPWLKKQLEDNSFNVWSPDMPNSDIPNLEDWSQVILNNNDWVFNKDSIMVGHSAGATFILRILEQIPDGIQIHKAILVAPVYNLGTIPDFFKYKRSMVQQPFNWEKIKKTCKKFYFYCSDNDPYQCGVDQSKIFYKHLGGELNIRKGEGHFNLEKSPQYKQFPELLEKILE
jgi:predicted alpha/beta hydrolase family esterase